LIAVATIWSALDTLRFANIHRNAPTLAQRPSWRELLGNSGDAAADGFSDAVRRREALVPRYRTFICLGGSHGHGGAFLSLRNAGRRQNGDPRDQCCRRFRHDFLPLNSLSAYQYNASRTDLP
jgi:hypothetical protein